MAKNFHLTRQISKYAWDPDLKESRKLEYDDKYDVMDWDDLISNIGYLLEGHKGQDVHVILRQDKDEEEERWKENTISKN